MKDKHALPPLRMYHFSSVIPMIFPMSINVVSTRLCFLLLSNLISEVAQKALCYDRVEISGMAEKQHFKKFF